MKMNKSKLFVILRILVSLCLLAFLLWLMRENFAKIGQILKGVNIAIFALAFSLFISTVILMAWRLKIILAAQELFFTIRDLSCLTLIGYFFTNFMPTSVGGDIVKGYYISKNNKKKLATYSSIFFDRAIGMFSFTLIAAAALLVMKRSIEHKFIIRTIVFLLSSCLVFGLSVFHRKLVKRIAKAIGAARLLQVLRLDSVLKKVYQTLSVYASRKDIIIKTLIVSLFAQFITFFSVFLLANSLSVHIPFGQILLFMPIIVVLCMLPITMNGLGLREWAFVFFFGASMGDAAALSLSLLYLAMFLLNSLVGGVIYLFWR